MTSNMFEGEVDMTNAPVYGARKFRTENPSLSILRDHQSLSQSLRILFKILKCGKSKEISDIHEH